MTSPLESRVPATLQDADNQPLASGVVLLYIDRLNGTFWLHTPIDEAKLLKNAATLQTETDGKRVKVLNLKRCASGLSEHYDFDWKPV
jgi:hypothetical protein